MGNEMTKNRTIILDVAHGIDAPGKRSPDGKHLEYVWSRNRVAKIYDNIHKSKNKITFDIFTPFLNEINEAGLINRVKKYNDIAKNYDATFVLSLHNDAFGDNWSKPHGVSVWTSKGETMSDKYATSLYNYLINVYPNEKFRSTNWLNEHEINKDPDWEANFTILAGNKYIKPLYDAVLLEWLFQTNKEDVKKLMNPIHNEYFEDMMTNWLINTFNHG